MLSGDLMPIRGARIPAERELVNVALEMLLAHALRAWEPKFEAETEGVVAIFEAMASAIPSDAICASDSAQERGHGKPPKEQP